MQEPIIFTQISKVILGQQRSSSENCAKHNISKGQAWSDLTFSVYMNPIELKISVVFA